MDIVSFETAKKLKDAGFPQLTNDIHFRAWYVDGELCVSMLGYMAMTFFIPMSFVDKPFVWDQSKGNDKIIFAPTATDIMRQMPGLPLVYDGPNFGISGDWYSNLNPAELMAERYLETK